MSIWLSGPAELADVNRRLARKLLHLWAATLALALLAEAPITWLNDWAGWVGRYVPILHHLQNRPGDIAAVVARFYALVCGLAPVGVAYLLRGDDPLHRLQIGLQQRGGWAIAWFYALGLPLLVGSLAFVVFAAGTEGLTPTGRYALLYWGLHSHWGWFIVGPLLAVFGCLWATLTAWLLVTPLIALVRWGKN